MMSGTVTVTLKSAGRWFFFAPGDRLQRAAEAGGVAEREQVLRRRASLPRELGLEAVVGGLAFAVAAADVWWRKWC